jgi:phosphoserine phosphatase
MPLDRPLANAHALTLAWGGQEGSRREPGSLGQKAREALGEADAQLLGERALSATAWEGVFHGDAPRVIASLRGQADQGADWCVQPLPGPAATPRVRRLLLCDMDSTIIGCECIDEIAAILGIKPQIAAITEQAMRGDIAFEPALEARVALLKGVRESDLHQVWAERVRLNPGAATLVASMKAQGARTVLVSGGFTWFTSRVAELAGFDVNHGNTLEVEDGRLTGRVVPPILGRAAKREALARHTGEIEVAETDSVAIGDGANDLDMMAASGLGVAYRAKPAVEAQSPARIVSGDLRSALYFQGLTQADFVERG